MMTPRQYSDAIDLATKVKRAGFELEVSGNRFCVMPKTGFAALLYPTDDKMFLDSVSDVLAFLHGWHAVAKACEPCTSARTSLTLSRNILYTAGMRLQKHWKVLQVLILTKLKVGSNSKKLQMY